MLLELQEKIEAVYGQAADDLEKKIRKHLTYVSNLEKGKKKALDSGAITQEQYDKWRKDMLLDSDTWKELKDVLALDMHLSNVKARSIIFGYMPEAYAANFNFGVFQTEKLAGVSTSFALYDRDTVERLMRDDPELLQPPGKNVKKTFAEFDAYKNGEDVTLDDATKKKYRKLIKANKDIRWQKGQLQSAALQAVVQGESVPHFAKRISKELPVKNEAAAVRYARTAMTAAQNAGRKDSYKRAQGLGVDVSNQWMAVHDNTTRNSHRQLDGEVRKLGERFSNGLEYPGDPSGAAAEIWNCRCTLAPVLNSFSFGTSLEPDGSIEGMSYAEWKEGKE